jgi:hypothetical protein
MYKFCSFCKNPLTPWYQWKGGDDRLYCNEFCADACEGDWDVAGEVTQISERREYSAQRA